MLIPQNTAATLCRHAVEYVPLNLGALQDFVDRGRLNPAQRITMHTLYAAGIVGQVKHGVKLLAKVRAWWRGGATSSRAGGGAAADAAGH